MTMMLCNKVFTVMDKFGFMIPMVHILPRPVTNLSGRNRLQCGGIPLFGLQVCFKIGSMEDDGQKVSNASFSLKDIALV